MPAHFSGICGLKPTPGRIPVDRALSLSAGPFALIGVVGPMARTVADLKALFEVMQGPDDGDTCAAPVPAALAQRRRSEENSRSAISKMTAAHPSRRKPAPAVRAAAEAAAAGRISSRTISSRRPRRGAQLLAEVFRDRWGNAAPSDVRRTRSRSESDPEAISGLVGDRTGTHGRTLLDAWIAAMLLRARFLAQMRQYPILLCPAAAIPAFRHGERSWKIDGKTVHYLDAWSYAEWFNLLGNPAAWFRSAIRREGCPSACRSSADPGRKSMCCPSPPRLEEAMSRLANSPALRGSL